MANTSRMHTAISSGQLTVMDNCFGLAGTHQHGVGTILSGCLRHRFKWQLHTTNVVSWDGTSTAALPRQACGKVDHQKRPVCHVIFKYNNPCFTKTCFINPPFTNPCFTNPIQPIFYNVPVSVFQLLEGIIRHIKLQEIPA